MRKLFITPLLVLCVISTFAQEKRNSVYIEGGGNTVYYSVNYDRLFDLSSKLKLAPRIGFMYLPMDKIYEVNDNGDYRIPIEVNLLWSNSETPKNFVEGGLGVSLISIEENVTYVLTGQNGTRNAMGKVYTLRLGFRHQKQTGGFMYRIGLLVPVAQDEYSNKRFGDDIFYRIYGGLSLGFTF